MLILVSSPVNQSGVSTMAHSIAFTYSNWVNRPTLVVSVKSDSFYKHKCKVKDDFNSKFLSIVNGNTGGHGDILTYTYKINDLLYYYQAHSSPVSSPSQHNLDLQIFLERASREFGVVVVDLDDEPNSFKKFLDIADVCFNVMPPDAMILKQANEQITDVLEDYKEAGGLGVRTKMYYIANKLDGGVSKSTVCKYLTAEQRSVFTIPYDDRFIKESNNNKLTAFLADTLLYKKSTKDKVLEVAYKRMFDAIRKL